MTAIIFILFFPFFLRIDVILILQGCRFGSMEPQVVPEGLVWCQELIFGCQIIRVG